MKLINYKAINSMINTLVASLFALRFMSVCSPFIYNLSLRNSFANTTTTL